MLTTPLCPLFGIEVPIILAPMGTCTSAELAAAVSNAGGLGGIGTLFRSFAAIKRDIDMVARLTQRPFAINHIPQTLDAEAFRYTLQARPAVISFTLADPGDLVRQAHDAGARVMVQVTTVDQALQAVERGADVISAQGSESGGYCGEVSTMTLVPQVVDAVSPIPVVASGGISTFWPGENGAPAKFEHTAFPDILCTNICWGGKDMRTAYVTMSSTGKLAACTWRSPGLPSCS